MNFLKRFGAGFAFAAASMAACLAILLAIVFAEAHFGILAAAAVFIFGVCTLVGMVVALD